MSTYTVNLQTYANSTATVDARDEGEAYEMAQGLAANLAARDMQEHGERGRVVLVIEVDDINNPVGDDIEESPEVGA